MRTRPQMIGALPEASGLALSRRTPNMLWSMDDSDDPVVVALSTTGEVKGRVRIAGAQVRDWEDVSVAPCGNGSCLYIADIGDDRTKRTSVTVYRVAEPAVGDPASAPAEALDFTYPDGHHDAEAAFIADDTIFVVTKGHPTILYRAPRGTRSGTPAMLQRVGELRINPMLKDRDRQRSRITDAETSPNGEWVALRTNSELVLARTRDLVAGRAAGIWSADLRPLGETQGEGVALSEDGDVYLAGEGGGHGLPGTFAHITCTLPK